MRAQRRGVRVGRELDESRTVEDPADHRPSLEDLALVAVEAFEPSGEQGMDGRRERELAEVSRGPRGAGALLENAVFLEHGQHLFDEQWITRRRPNDRIPRQ